jgi:hypothetical protein
MLAVGLALSYHVLSLYYQRLICHNLPPREVIVSSFIPVGAIGMGGWALLNLAGAADIHVRAFYLESPDAFEDSNASACECCFNRCCACKAWHSCHLVGSCIVHTADTGISLHLS